MQVGLLSDLLYYRLAAGSTRYATQLAHHLARSESVDLRLFSLCSTEDIQHAAREKGVPIAESVRDIAPRQLRYVLWHAVGMAGGARRILDTVDVVHTPTFLVPPRRKTPLVVTVLDLSVVLFPNHHGRWWRTLAAAGLRRAVREADALIAISKHTADDLVRVTGVDARRIHVIPLAADSRFAPVVDSSVPPRYGIEYPYLLYVGTLEPRKNLDVLLHAFARLDHPDLQLVLAGPKGWMFEEIFALVDRLGLTSRVVFPGFVADADLPALMNSAAAFVYPSEYEGFGLPVLEAMSCGVPVVTTNVSSLPEVTGNAALLVPPRDVDALCRVLRCLLTEQHLRDEMREKGLERASAFSWVRTAQATAEVYENVVS
jgi:glycosyltransferase involved in cell wall biosynthesis